MADANLTVQIQAENTKLLKSIDDSQKKINTFVEHSSSGFDKMKHALEAIAAVAVITKLVEGFDHITSSITEMAETAQRFGIPLGELEKLQFGAAQAGVSTEELSGSLTHMERALKEAATAGSPAAKAFEKLGLSVDTLRGQSADKTFLDIADAIKRSGSQTEALGSTMDIFGARSTKILQVLQSDLKGSGTEFDSLGLKMTDAQGKQVKEFEDGLKKISATFDAFQKQIVSAAAPALTEIVKGIQKAIEEYGGLAAVAKDTAGVIISGANSIIAIFGAVDKAIYKIKGTFEAVAGSIAKAAAFITQKDTKDFTGPGSVSSGQGTGKGVSGVIDAGDALFAQAQKDFSATGTAGLQKIVSEGQEKVGQIQSSNTAAAKPANPGFASIAGDNGQATSFGTASSVPSAQGLTQQAAEVKVTISVDQSGTVSFTNLPGVKEAITDMVKTAAQDTAREVSR